MTSMTTVTAEDRRRPGRPAGERSPRGRAVIADLRLNRDQIAGTVLLAAGALVVLALGSDLLTSLAPLWAALAWYSLGRADTLEVRALRAGLGISRGDALRARVLVVGGVSALMVLLATIGAAVTAVRDPSSVQPALAIPGGDAGGAAWTCVIDALFCCLVLVFTALSVGRECVTRRPGWGMFGITLLSLVGSAFAAALTTWAPLVLVELAADAPRSAVLTEVGAVVVLILELCGAVWLLRRRIRGWIRSLDSAR